MPNAAVAGRRKDAQRNRARLLDAARSVFAAAGPRASLEEIARTAGVGIATLYRHFPSRAHLVSALFDDESARWLAVGRRALEEEHAEDGLRLYFHELIELQAQYGPMRLVLAEHRAVDLGDAQAEMTRLTEELLVRAREEGAVREDFTLADLAMLFWSLAHLHELSEAAAPRAWRRQLGFVLDGLRPEAASLTTVPPLSAAEMAAVAARVVAR